MATASLYQKNQYDPQMFALAAPSEQSSLSSAFANAFLGADSYLQTSKERDQKDKQFDSTIKTQGLTQDKMVQDMEKGGVDIQNAKNELSLFDFKKQKYGIDLDNAQLDNSLKHDTYGFLIDEAKYKSANAKSVSELSAVEALFAPQKAKADIEYRKSATSSQYADANFKQIQMNAIKEKIKKDQEYRISTQSIDKLSDKAGSAATADKTVGQVLDNFNMGKSSGWFDQGVSIIGNGLGIESSNYTTKPSVLRGGLNQLVDTAKDAFQTGKQFSDADAERMKSYLPNAWNPNNKDFLIKIDNFLDAAIAGYGNRIKTYQNAAKSGQEDPTGATPTHLKAWSDSINGLATQKARVKAMLDTGVDPNAPKEDGQKDGILSLQGGVATPKVDKAAFFIGSS